MQLQIPPPELVPYGLRAMKVVAMADGVYADAERAMLATAQELFGTNYDIDALDPIEPEELAAKLKEPEMQRQMLYAMLALSLADGDASAEEAEVIEAFRAALSIESHEVATFRKLADGQIMAARFDVARRFWGLRELRNQVKELGLKWLAKVTASFLNLYEDEATAKKYRGLEAYPANSLGRSYYDFIVANQFSFPGEKGSPPEPIVVHDLTHVLSDYGTTPDGEICVCAFHAGYQEQDPFTFILLGMMQFNLGIVMGPIAEASMIRFDSTGVLEALRRGSAMNTDLSDGTWDYWEDMKHPLEEIRSKYNIIPIGGDLPPMRRRDSARSA